MKIASIDTGIADRDGHLVSGDFFDAEKFPLMTFRSTRAEQLGGDTYRITGDLTIKDVTRPLSIDLEFNGSAPTSTATSASASRAARTSCAPTGA